MKAVIVMMLGTIASVLVYALPCAAQVGAGGAGGGTGGGPGGAPGGTGLEAPGLQVSAWLPADRIRRPVEYRRLIPE
jgi:hypothetical protein